MAYNERDEAEAHKTYAAEDGYATIGSVERLAKKIAQLESAVYTNSAGNISENTAIKKPYHNHHEHEWLACGSSGQGGGGGPSVNIREWACYCGATKKETITEPKRANL